MNISGTSRDVNRHKYPDPCILHREEESFAVVFSSWVSAGTETRVLVPRAVAPGAAFAAGLE